MSCKNGSLGFHENTPTVITDLLLQGPLMLTVSLTVCVRHSYERRVGYNVPLLYCSHFSLLACYLRVELTCLWTYI
jgi:hypothetical protein